MKEVWRAPAKINLWLRVTGRRADGYHEVDTCLQAIDLCDEVILEAPPPGRGAELRCRVEGELAAGVPDGEANLAARAARLIAERTGHTLRLWLTVRKRIPAGAGLGGGSSDAAAVLLALARRFAVPDSERTLRDLARELGADVAFFLEGGTQFATGIGERITPASPPPERWGILAWPGPAVSTAWAYGALEMPASRAPEAIPGEAPATPRRRSLPAGWKAAGNRFEASVFERHPVVERALGVLAAGPSVTARMSGSGSALFALYASEAVRDGDLTRVRRELAGAPGARIWRFQFLPHGVRPC